VPASKLRLRDVFCTLTWVLRCLLIVAPRLVGASNTGGPLVVRYASGGAALSGWDIPLSRWRNEKSIFKLMRFD